MDGLPRTRFLYFLPFVLPNMTSSSSCPFLFAGKALSDDVSEESAARAHQSGKQMPAITTRLALW